MIKIIMNSDYDDMMDSINAVGDQPSAKMVLLLNNVLHRGFTFVQEDTHVQTSSLLQSEKSEGGVKYKRWEGKITAGGPSGGVNNPVDYAIYEKARDGAHDFFRRLPLLHSSYIRAIQNGMKK